MQLRSLEDHSPLPNIIVGDIGTKMGNGAYNSMDNGFLMFDHVRIPRDQMLMRSSLLAFFGLFLANIHDVLIVLEEMTCFQLRA